jgi:hypothetical protein
MRVVRNLVRRANRREISELQNRRVKVDTLVGNNLSIFTRTIAGSNDLPPMIIRSCVTQSAADQMAMNPRSPSNRTRSATAGEGEICFTLNFNHQLL